MKADSAALNRILIGRLPLCIASASLIIDLPGGNAISDELEP